MITKEIAAKVQRRIGLFCAGNFMNKLVKIDIEGAEYGVLESILKSGNLPEIICVDFDEMSHVINWNTKKRMNQAFTGMLRNGYKPVWIEGDSVTFRKD